MTAVNVPDDPGGLLKEPPEFEDFYRRATPGLVAMLIAVTRARREDAAECVQDTLIKILPPKWYEIAPNKRMAWCRTTALNAYKDLMDRRRREVLVDDIGQYESGLFPSASHADESDATRTIRQLLDRLPSERRAVTALHLHGASNAEIATLRGSTQSTVRTTVQEGLQQLTKLMGEAGL